MAAALRNILSCNDFIDLPAASCPLGFDPGTSGSLVEKPGSFVDSRVRSSASGLFPGSFAPKFALYAT
jgi:hypothetical protein